MIAAWGWVAAAYAAYMATLAGAGFARHRALAVLAAVALGVAAAAASTVDSRPAQVVFPGAVALAGYWLSGLFAGVPQAWLEARLLDADRRLFEWLRIDRTIAGAPRLLLEALELAYATVYVVVLVGSIAMARRGVEPVRHYWAIVLAAGFVCYAALPFVRSRPPRSLEPPGALARRAPVMRRFNERIVRTGSIQVNTIPSGHVAAALAASLAAWSSSPVIAGSILACAVLIAVAATAGRYHYAFDCVLGAVVAIVVWVAAK